MKACIPSWLYLSSLALAVIGSPLSAIDFPRIESKLHNPGGLDLTGLKVKVELELDDPNTEVGQHKVIMASWDPARGILTFPAVTFGNPLPRGRGDPFVDDWGIYYSYNIHFNLPAPERTVSDLKYYSWERRPRNSTAQMLQDLKVTLADISLYAVSKPATLLLPAEKKFSGKNVYIIYYRQFQSKTDHFSDSGDFRLKWKLPTFAGTQAPVPLMIPPFLHVVRGSPSIYGTPPTTLTGLYFYVEEKREGKEVGVRYGVLKETAAFSSDSHFKADNPQLEIDLNPLKE